MIRFSQINYFPITHKSDILTKDETTGKEYNDYVQIMGKNMER